MPTRGLRDIHLCSWFHLSYTSISSLLAWSTDEMEETKAEADSVFRRHTCTSACSNHENQCYLSIKAPPVAWRAWQQAMTILEFSIFPPLQSGARGRVSKEQSHVYVLTRADSKTLFPVCSTIKQKKIRNVEVMAWKFLDLDEFGGGIAKERAVRTGNSTCLACLDEFYRFFFFLSFPFKITELVWMEGQAVVCPP